MTDIFKQHIAQLIDIEDDEYERVRTYFKTKNCRKRQFLVQEGQAVTQIYFVQKGLLKSSFVDDIGKEHILQFACENWWVSDFTAFYKQEISTIAVDCIEDAELLSISFQDLDLICKEIPKMEHFFRLKSNFGFVALQKRILSLMSDSAKSRYESFCQQYPNILQRVPKQLIANYLGLSRETLSRLQM